ncbi:hypothetical protein GPECTOR_157g91 [Gonium pectorale]|uniref:Ubiquitin thioesterase OTU n=1 Tax=Gonium pectorale TaxID=33097 RepID=A0A150FXL4_GONPE|nr:hypothetical protein GPECTOR_157g91 [Gonium pectorale]|eukprot:KXZ42353.1 hypothetical protein GPECTOR_157g91 [Gonium pectorale]
MGPCSKIKPTAKCVPLSDGSGVVVRREIPADNSCLFNSIGYVMHKSKTRAPHLRNVVARQVAGDRTTYSDAFLGMSNEAYCSWIRQPFNWGGGIELSILAQAYSMEIAAWNIESCKEHVFGEESGYTRQAMVIYNGVHYDALAVAASPRANPEEDETNFDPRSKRGKMILAAARKLTTLAHKESAFHSANKKPPASSSATQNGTAKSSGSKATDAKPAADGASTSSAATTNAAAKSARPSAVTRRVPRAAASAAASAAAASDAAAAAATAAAASKLSCGDCGEVLCGSAAAAEHAKATGHQSFVEVAA